MEGIEEGLAAGVQLHCVGGVSLLLFLAKQNRRKKCLFLMYFVLFGMISKSSKLP